MEIPYEVLSTILDFTGEGNYAFISPVCKRMLKLHNEKFKKKTYYKNILSSESRLCCEIDSGYTPCYRDLHVVAQCVKTNIESIMNILFQKNVRWDKNSMVRAVEYNNKEYLLWVLSSGLDFDTYSVCCACAMFDNVDIFKMFTGIRYTYTIVFVKIAAHYESKNLLRWFMDGNIDKDNSFMEIMAENGYIETIKELVQKYGLSCNQKTLNCAAIGSCVETIEYLLNNHKCEVTKETIYHSSCSSNPEVRSFFKTRYPEFYNEHILDILERYSL